MPWNTSKGKRCLEGAEARLFAIAIPTIIDFFNDDEHISRLNWGCPLIEGRFELLHPSEQFAVLENVANSLLTQNSPEAPALDEYNEGAIYYVYKWLMEQFDDVEIGVEVWGEHVIAAYDECFPPRVIEDTDETEDIYERVNMKCKKKRVWEQALEELSDMILWDRDFEDYSLFSESGAVADMILARADISEQYFHSPKKYKNSPGAKERLYRLTSRIAYGHDIDEPPSPPLVLAATAPAPKKQKVDNSSE